MHGTTMTEGAELSSEDDEDDDDDDDVVYFSKYNVF